MIRLEFPGYTRPESLESISWSEWFHVFDVNDLTFFYQDETADGARSKFNELVGRRASSPAARESSHVKIDRRDTSAASCSSSQC